MENVCKLKVKNVKRKKEVNLRCKMNEKMLGFC